MLFFRSEAHLERWLRAQGGERGAVLTLADTWQLSKAWYPDRRRAEWKPRTVAQSQHILDSLGLAPDRAFWTLQPVGS